MVEMVLKEKVFGRWRGAEGLKGRRKGLAQRELEVRGAEGESVGGLPMRGRTSKRRRRTSASSSDSLHESLDPFSREGGAELGLEGRRGGSKGGFERVVQREASKAHFKEGF